MKKKIQEEDVIDEIKEIMKQMRGEMMEMRKENKGIKEIVQQLKGDVLDSSEDVIDEIKEIMKQMRGEIMEMKKENKEINEYLKKANDKLKEVLLHCAETKLCYEQKKK